MELLTWVRLGLVFAHLLCSAFSLHLVLRTDLQLLSARIDPVTLARVHRRVSLLLTLLWATGLPIAGIDIGFDAAHVADHPKLIAKLTCVSLLTANGVLIGRFCLPRIASGGRLGALESMVVMVSGGVSTASWLMAAFFGVAKPLARSPAAFNLGLYAAALSAAVAVALGLNTWRRGPDGWTLLRPPPQAAPVEAGELGAS